MRYQFNTRYEYVEMWKHCMIIGIGFTYCQDEFWVESAEFDEDDKWFVDTMVPLLSAEEEANDNR